MGITQIDRIALRQEIFNTVVPHLRRQKYRSKSSKGYLCSYYGLRGRKSAVGVLIPESVWEPSMNHLTLSLIHQKYALVLPDYFNDYLMREFLLQLEIAHNMLLEKANQRQKWKKKFEAKIREIALVYGLEIPDEKSEKTSD